MKHFHEYLLYGIEYKARTGLSPLKHRWQKGAYPYCGRKSQEAEKASGLWKSLLEKGEPFSVARFGFFELSALRNFYFQREKTYPSLLESLRKSAGVFPPTLETGNRFVRLMGDSLGKADYLVCSGEPYENLMAARFSKKELVWVPGLEALTPWALEIPWSSGLSGKKVLVVNPFAETVKKQYEKRQELFKGTEILPDFKLSVYPSLLTIGEYRDSHFPDFFSTLDYQFEEIRKRDFEVALLGCGAYGFPLAVRIKEELGKTAIHMGGVLQLLFGILGARWDGSRFPGQGPLPEIAPFVNEHWTYPSPAETPEAAAGVEYGPYWNPALINKYEK
ncbi:MAG: hypothetical protein IJU50_06260 [Lachnospiraceae bacterium]|nr:hypothetical protein [Lachnospiraceae bacterium]